MKRARSRWKSSHVSETTLTEAPRTSLSMSAFSPKLAPAPSRVSSLYDLAVEYESAPPTYTETSPELTT